MIDTTLQEPRVTNRAMLDPTRRCSLKCSFCYYLPQDDLHTVKPLEAQLDEVRAALARGCNCADLTGGEPMQNPHVVDLIRFATSSGLPTRIISSLICPERTLDEVLDAGVDDWLISMHGAREETHNAIVKVPKARTLQIRRLAKIAARMRYCCNYVMVEANQLQMVEWARWLLSLDHAPPKVVNFINFNVFGNWLANDEWKDKARANVVDITVTGPILDEAIRILESAGVGVNVRYYPMCGLSPWNRKNICNDLHVAFDQGEWDNAFGATSTVESVLTNYSIPLSNRNEEKGAPCCDCDLQWCCGGANKLWHQFAREKFGHSPLVPITLAEGPVDYWHYRGQNVLGLDPTRPAPATPPSGEPRTPANA